MLLARMSVTMMVTVWAKQMGGMRMQLLGKSLVMKLDAEMVVVRVLLLG
jgi:hypothetical protein